jgi:hypothetical protein
MLRCRSKIALPLRLLLLDRLLNDSNACCTPNCNQRLVGQLSKKCMLLMQQHLL